MTLSKAILVVEDDASLARVLQLRLSMLGHAVTTCSNGREALDLCFDDTRCFDLILMDLRMPVMDGLEAARELRACESTRCIPIVCVSAEDNFSEAREQGSFDYFLRKPFSKTELFEALQAVGLLEIQS